MQIAICDDEKSIGLILEEKIKKLLPDAVIDKYLSGDELIASGCEPDILFLDIQMPVMDGYKATVAMRNLEVEDPHRRRAVIVGMSANAFREDVDKALSLGMDDYITKPIDVKELSRVLNKYCKV